MNVAVLDIKVVKIHRLMKESRVKAFADLEINEALLIKGIRIVHGTKGLFISMPLEKGRDEKWYERVRCLNGDIRSLISQKVLEAYGGNILHP